jgi:translation initiation factor 1 (eIF-1/SUI1)
VRYGSSTMRMATVEKRKKQKISVSKIVKILKPLCAVGGNVNEYSHYGKWF